MRSKIVAVTFNDRSDYYTGRSGPGKHYHYLTDIDVQVGDTCVVDAPGGAALVTVRSLEPVGGIRKATKWIVDRVDRSGFEARERAREELADLRVEAERELERVMVAEQRALVAAKYPLLAATLVRIEQLEQQLGW